MRTVNRKLLFCLFLLPLAVAAQAYQTPLTPQEFDSFSWLSRSISALLSANSDVLIPDAIRWHRILGGAMLGLIGVNIAWESVGGRSQLVPSALRSFLFWYVISGIILTHWTGFRHLFTDTSVYLQAKIEFSAMDTAGRQIAAIQGNLFQPSAWDPLMSFVYAAIIFLLSIVSALFDSLASFGLLAMAVGGIIGPLFILVLPLPRFQHWSWGWIGAMIKYSFYGVVGSCFVNVLASFLVHYLDNSAHGLYTAAGMLALFGGLIKIVVMILYALFQFPHVVSDFTSGAAHAGSGLGNTLLFAFRRR